MSLTLPSPLERWRLMLGEAAEGSCGGLSPAGRAADAALEWLYGQDKTRLERDERSAGLGPSQLTAPEWINQINQLFPQEVIERLERDAVEKYGIHEIVTNLDVLERIEPSETLLQAVLQTKHLMNPEVLAAARKLVAEVVRRIMEKMHHEIRLAFHGTRNRNRPSRIALARNFDFKNTVRHNLKYWQPQQQKLYIQRPHFISRSQRHLAPWQVILLVDQSGSMVSSVIHSAIMAACLWQLPGMKTHLIAFDTAVVDLTLDVGDPVELLMKVQLGGGTDIAKAVAYAQNLISNPSRSVVVIVSDFYEGGNPTELIQLVKKLHESGSKVLGLAALDANCSPIYDRELAQRLVNVGAQIGAMTPGQLAGWLAECLRM